MPTGRIIAIVPSLPINKDGIYCKTTVGGAFPDSLPNPSGSLDIMIANFGEQFDSGQYIIQTDADVVGGSISVAIATLSPRGNINWITAAIPNSSTKGSFTLIETLAASSTYNGSLNDFLPCAGIGLQVDGLDAGLITLMQLNLTRH